ncbi:Sporulation related domain-containing protein [Capnocytophaga haemolytica]|uniref:Sporulation protein n=1 Tax=Capnocytophaga haemolytica TaxID=45243 RepID=A0AAX2H0J8_9FLAO|nr:SPOR domain-containing protein [Capnocytophaga haemolytica]AMD84100.1 sporulation protein [Capnocytophaga haemolytica]SFO06707.1 Sporulation related domain-containing protein [Capnocytophaga haemolytica]SNV13504.1 Sporulation related domain [Capnocytophaga haemolytica]
MTQKGLITGILLLFFAAVGYSQVTYNQGANIAEAMELKKEVARNESAYQVQIYNGNITEANKAILDVKSKLKQYPASLSFETPNYKVRVGSFRTRLEAEKNLPTIKRLYPAAFVVAIK